MFDPTIHPAAALIGLIVGLLSGLFGVGGGFLLVPVLTVILGVPVEIAVGSSACQVLGPATTALLTRRPTRETFRLPLVITGGLFIGVIAGAWFLGIAKQAGTITFFSRTLPAADLAVMGIYFVLFVVLGVFSIVESGQSAGRMVHLLGVPARAKIPPMSYFEGCRRRLSVPVICWLGLITGALSGLLGMSGGLVLIPGLIYLLGMQTSKATAASLVIVWLISFQATIAHAWADRIDLPLVAALLLGGTIGARLGTMIAAKTHARTLRGRFGWLLLAAAGLTGYRLWVILTQ
ncbi:sulfite exporter TauE/SafE family protein [Stratiformator vulcanicus]|uniref:Probable membrane transporter protein n=1 Tax=Stratiformator vulcanicus TaxID=2527980 RepID=A0A517R7K8_9PLAN|nr:TSUP family transporter [Stratiformator vulcanicus]QDT39855.1 Sulfite exporter TauE/SafE [Stratiformator vulcanicus]